MYVRTMHQGDHRQGAAASGSGDVPAADLSLARRRELVRAVTDVLVGVEGVLHQGVGAELGPFFAELDALRRGCEAGQVATLAEALERGEVSTCATAAGWVLEWAPSYRSGGAGDLVKVAQACVGRPVGAGAAHVLDHGSVQRLRGCVLAGRVGVRCAAVALTEMRKLGPRLTPAALPTVWEGSWPWRRRRGRGRCGVCGSGSSPPTGARASSRCARTGSGTG
ncbi:hypothetical protein GCM10009657_11380 [Oryzihumus leptocrescens]